jgi:hypothetical protein
MSFAAPASDSALSLQRLSRRIAQAAGSFEHLLMHRAPASITIVATDQSLVLTIHEPFSPAERRLAADGGSGLSRVAEYHRSLFDNSLDALCRHVRLLSGVELHGAAIHVDARTGSVLKTLTTKAAVDTFVFGEGVPMLGVAIDEHVHAGEVA